jgi:hypothetical protein
MSPLQLYAYWTARDHLKALESVSPSLINEYWARSKRIIVKSYLQGRWNMSTIAGLKVDTKKGLSELEW